MRNSIIAKILIIIAAVLIITDMSLLGLGFYSVYTTVHRNYISYAKSSATIAADLLDDTDMKKLQTDAGYAEYYKTVLGDLCRTNDLEYLYVYIPDIENKTITYVMLIYGEHSQSSAVTERVPGTVVEHELNQSEICVWNGNETDNVEETNNKYGHVMTSYSAVYDKDGNVAALVGADVSTDEAFRIFFRRYRIMVAAVIISFVFVLGVIAAILKIKVLKPAEIISRRMKSFVTDRQFGFEKLGVNGNDEFAQMSDAFNSMAEEIDSYIKNINELTEEKHRQEAEINIAKNIQTGFLQDKSFENSRIRISATMVPAKYVGGDFYDYFTLSNDNVCIVIADVSGKGISAALFMARAITVVRQYAQLGYSPSEILFHTNNCLSLNNPEQMFLTVFVGIYNSNSHIFTYANGGHNTPYLISDTLISLDDVSGMTVGIFEDEDYDEASVVLKNGDTVFLYTDGVNEAVNVNKEFFGINRLEDILKKNGNEKCVDIVFDEVKNFAKDTQQSDDITMLALCILPDTCINVKADLDNLSIIQNLIIKNDSIPVGLKSKLCLAAEEIFVNICSYAYGKDKGNVEFSVEVSDKIVIKFCDSGKRFNPLENTIDIDDYDIDTQIGGLGRMIAFDIADKADYEYKDNKNILTIIKHLKEEQ
ncbi:MAG: SpoIIE family protein phosphatase [Lachnospiraceae bacterium]|nr:SpoIIE family protein phosphatase [Lachnospiraceae bacterium]